MQITDSLFPLLWTLVLLNHKFSSLMFYPQICSKIITLHLFIIDLHYSQLLLFFQNILQFSCSPITTLQSPKRGRQNSSAIRCSGSGYGIQVGPGRFQLRLRIQTVMLLGIALEYTLYIFIIDLLSLSLLLIHSHSIASRCNFCR